MGAHALFAQTFMMAMNGNDTGFPDPSPGPTDDGYIAVAVKSVPQDPFCCSGPNTTEDGAPLHYFCLQEMFGSIRGLCQLSASENSHCH